MSVARRGPAAVKDDMRHPGRWWLGLCALALAWIAADLVETPRVERDIRERAMAVIAQDARVEDATARVAGRDVTLVGISASFEDADALVARVAGLRGVRLVRSSILPPPVASPYVLSFARSGDDIVISGDVPSRKVRAQVVAKAAKSGKRVVDRLTYAGGAPRGDLSVVAAAAMAALAKLDDGSVTVRDALVAVTGSLPTAAERQAVERDLSSALPAPFVLGPTHLGTSVASPYVLRVERSLGEVRLSGSVPDEAARSRIVDALKAGLPGVAIRDDLAVDAGAPPGVVSAVMAAMPTLSRLHEGTVTFGEKGVDVLGRDPKAAEEARSSLASALGPGFLVRSRMASGIDLGFPSVAAGEPGRHGSEPGSAERRDGQAAAPYPFRLDIDEGKVHLVGNAPDEDARRKIEATARTQFFDATVKDDLKVVAGAPEGFARAVTSAIPSLARLGKGTFTLSYGKAEVTGEAAYPRAADEIKSALKAAVGPGFAVGGDVGVAVPGQLEPSACQPTFDRLLDKGHIEFTTDSAELPAQSTPLLDRLVAVAKRCTTAVVAVSGYTDATGTKEHNVGLSQRRAQSVVEFLAGTGVDTARISAVGQGQDAPVASNATPEGRAENRHVEFRVVR